MEANNMEALRAAARAALEKVNEIYDILSKPCIAAEEARQACREARGLLIPAFAKPPRNCDVGSAEEQSRRYDVFCEAHHMQCDKGCSACPCSKKSGVSCELYWAQMPYAKKEEDDCGKSGE